MVEQSTKFDSSNPVAAGAVREKNNNSKSFMESSHKRIVIYKRLFNKCNNTINTCKLQFSYGSSL